MAHFYATAGGQSRGVVSRTGNKNSGAYVAAASWEGSVRVRLYHDAGAGRDMAVVTMEPWKGVGDAALLYRGPVGEYAPEQQDASEKGGA